MTNQEIYGFVKNGLAQGRQKESLTADLIKGGWAQSDIDEAFAAVQGSSLSGAIAATPLKAYSNNQKAAFIIGALILLGIGIYYFLPQNQKRGLVATTVNGGRYLVSQSTCPSSSDPISTTATYSNSLPDGATVTDIGNGLEQYKDPKYHFSFNFPSDQNVRIVIQAATAAYGVEITNSPSQTQSALLVQLDDQDDCVRGAQFRGTPPSHPSTGTQSVMGGGTEFLLWDNVSYAQKYNSSNFEVVAAAPNEITVVPGDSYSLEFAYQFTAASDEQKYLNLVQQVVTSINFF